MKEANKAQTGGNLSVPATSRQPKASQPIALAKPATSSASSETPKAKPEAPWKALPNAEFDEIVAGIKSKNRFSVGAGLAEYVELNKHDSLGLLALAIFGAAGEIRSVLSHLSLQDGMGCREMLRMAEAIVQQRVLYELTDDAKTTTMRMPLPGISGLVTREMEFFLNEIAYRLHDLQGPLCAIVLPAMGDGNRAVFLAEALALAEEIVDVGGGNTEIGTIREAHPRLEYRPADKPSRLLRGSQAIKAAALGTPLAA